MARPGEGAQPAWINFWLLFSGFVCMWDASFIFLRPDTLPGGKLHTFWKPYALYIEVDERYKDMQDSFVYVVSILNYIEVMLNFLCVYLFGKGIHRQCQLLTFTVSVMTFWKTVLYMLQYLECFGGGEYSKQNDLTTTLFLLWLPNTVWIVMPLAVMVYLWPELAAVPQVIPEQPASVAKPVKYTSTKYTTAKRKLH